MVRNFLYNKKKYIKGYFYNSSFEHKKIYHNNLKELDRKLIEGELTEGQPMRERLCPLCGEQTQHFLFRTKLGYSYVKCNNCDMAYMSPVPTSQALDALYNSDEISFNYSNWSTESSVGIKGFHYLHDFIFHYKNSGRFLDVGCATGSIIKAASEKFDAEGLEINAKYAAIANKKGIKVHNIYSSDYFPNYQYDAISLLQVIEHLEHPDKVLNDCFRLLKKGGMLFTACPNIDSVSMDLFLEEHRHLCSFAHINMYAPKTLQLQTEKAGFKTVEVNTYMLDVSLHDLFYFYFNREKFSHRFSGYNPFTFQLFNTLQAPIIKFIERQYIKKNKGSYLAGVFIKP